MIVYAVSELDVKYGCQKVVRIFSSRERAISYIDQRIVEDYDGHAILYPWYSHEGIEIFSIKEMQVD
jgi:hypothetical protein